MTDAPGFNHWTAVFSVFYVALALPIGAWAASARAALSPATQRLAYVGLAAALVVLGLVNVAFYFGSYYANPNVLVKTPYRTAQGYYEIQSMQSRYQASLGPAYQVRVVGLEVPPYDPKRPPRSCGDRTGRGCCTPKRIARAAHSRQRPRVHLLPGQRAVS